MSEIVVLRGEYFVNHDPNTVICSPNAKNGEILLLSGNGFAAMIHVDNEANIKDIGKIITNLSEKDPNFKCTIMGRDSDSLRGHITDLLKRFNPAELNQETWSGSHPYNVSLSLDGTISLNNSAEVSRKYLHEMLFTNDGEQRLSKAVSSQTVDKLRKISVPGKEIKAIKTSRLQEGKSAAIKVT